MPARSSQPSPQVRAAEIMSVPALPQIVFGRSHATALASEAQIFEHLGSIGRPVSGVRKLPNSALRLTLSSILMPQLALIAAASDPVQIDTILEQRMTFIIPISGEGYTRYRTQAEPWNAHSNIIATAYKEKTSFIYTSMTSILVIAPAPERIIDTFTTMFPDEPMLLQKAINHDGIVRPRGHERRDFRTMFLSLCSLIETCNCDVEHLKRIGLDDVVFRLCSEYLRGDAQASHEQPKARSAPRSARGLDIICDHISQNTGNPLTLTQMEKMTNMSGRALNYAFRDRFGCSPQQWQRNFNLDRARTALLASDRPRSIKEVSYEFGFASPQSFSSFYIKRFGEKPSMTSSSTNSKKP